MNLEYISNKIEALLNNNNNPLKDFYFYVATEGFYLDTVADLSVHKNIIPVFVNQLGGENNPVPGFGQKDFNVSIHIYFPIMFKSVFYELEDYLDELFVGQIVDFAPIGGSPDCALCNINIPKFTTIMDAGLIEFKTWTQSVYGLAVDTANFWMDMEVDLYTSTVKDLDKHDGFLYGNNYSCSLSVTLSDGVTTLTENNPKFLSSTNMSNSEPAAEQILGTLYSKGLPASTSYSKEIPLYVKNNDFYARLLNEHYSKTLQGCKLTFTDHLILKNASSVKYTNYSSTTAISVASSSFSITISTTDCNENANDVIVKSIKSSSSTALGEVLEKVTETSRSFNADKTAITITYQVNLGITLTSIPNPYIVYEYKLKNNTYADYIIDKEYLYYITNSSVVSAKGTPLGITLNIADRIED